MSREWCIPLRISALAERADVDLVRLTLEMGHVDFAEDGDAFLCFVDAPKDPKKARKRVRHLLHESGVGHAVVSPLRILQWDDESRNWIDPRRRKPRHATPPDNIHWVATVTPSDAFQTARIRTELRRHGCVVLASTDFRYVVAARDEAEARELAESLGSLPGVKSVEVRQLGRLERWRVRRTLLGTYAAEASDDVLFAGGGDGGGDGGGGGGDG